MSKDIDPKDVKPTETELAARTEDAPATHKLVSDVRNELKADMLSLDAKIDRVDARISSVDARISSVDAKVNGLDAKVDSVEKRLTLQMNIHKSELESSIHETKSAVHRMLTLMEEQRSDNRIMYESLAAMNAKLREEAAERSKLEKRQERTEDRVFALEMASKPTL